MTGKSPAVGKTDQGCLLPWIQILSTVLPVKRGRGSVMVSRSHEQPLMRRRKSDFLGAFRFLPRGLLYFGLRLRIGVRFRGSHLRQHLVEERGLPGIHLGRGRLLIAVIVVGVASPATHFGGSLVKHGDDGV